jgi:RecG-like helicase
MTMPMTVPIVEVPYRERVCVEGRVRFMRIQPWADAPTLECALYDETGGLIVIFLGRRRVAGITLGTELTVEGMVGQHHGTLAMINPDYDIVPGSALPPHR